MGSPSPIQTGITTSLAAQPVNSKTSRKEKNMHTRLRPPPTVVVILLVMFHVFFVRLLLTMIRRHNASRPRSRLKNNITVWLWVKIWFLLTNETTHQASIVNPIVVDDAVVQLSEISTSQNQIVVSSCHLNSFKHLFLLSFYKHCKTSVAGPSVAYRFDKPPPAKGLLKMRRCHQQSHFAEPVLKSTAVLSHLFQ